MRDQGLSVATQAAHRHRPHQAQAAAEVARADTLLDRVLRLCERSECLVTSAEEILQEARKAKDARGALETIRTAAVVARELRGHLGLLGELSGELREGQQGPMVQAVIVLPGSRAVAGQGRADLSMPALHAPQGAQEAQGDVIDVECVESPEEPAGRAA